MSSAERPRERRTDAGRRTMDALTDGGDVFETFFDRVQTGLALADLSTRYIRVNASYAELVGRPAEDLIGVPFLDVVHPADQAHEDDRLKQLLSGHKRSLRPTDQRLVGPHDAEIWVQHSATVVPDETGRLMWFAFSAHDISDRRRAVQTLQDMTEVLTEQTLRDPLTGLANRALLHQRLGDELARAGRTGVTTGLLFLDLNDFKQINDRHGHGVGDLVLTVVADRLLAAVRPSDTVARPGGDEFVVLVEDTSEEGLQALVDRLDSAVAAPIRTGSLNLTVGVSIGVALSRDGDSTPTSLVDRADQAMYDAKRANRQARSSQ